MAAAKSSACFLILMGVASLALELPSYIPRCNHVEEGGDVEAFNECIMKAANDTRDIMRKGIPELGIPTISYVVIPKIEVEQKSRAFQYKCIFESVGVTGLDEYILKNVRYVLKNFSFAGDIYLKNINLNGTYDVRGKIFGEEVAQNGPMTATMNDIVAHVKLSAKYVMKENVKYAEITNVDIDVDVGDVVGKFHNLFGKNQVLNKATDEFLAESSRVIVETAKPDIINLIKHLIMLMVNRITKLIPFDSYFPPPK